VEVLLFFFFFFFTVSIKSLWVSINNSMWESVWFECHWRLSPTSVPTRPRWTYLKVILN